MFSFLTLLSFFKKSANPTETYFIEYSSKIFYKGYVSIILLTTWKNLQIEWKWYTHNCDNSVKSENREKKFKNSNVFSTLNPKLYLRIYCMLETQLFLEINKSLCYVNEERLGKNQPTFMYYSIETIHVIIKYITVR